MAGTCLKIFHACMMATPLPALAPSAMAGANLSVGGDSFPDTGNTRRLAILNKGF